MTFHELAGKFKSTSKNHFQYPTYRKVRFNNYMHSAFLNSAGQWRTMQNSEGQCRTVQYKGEQCRTVKYSARQCRTMENNAEQ
jgi:hypothetical protein